MSNVYTLEPPTSGKVILITNYGNIDVELWTKEAPRACRNFLQLCMEGNYTNNMFFRIVKGFMIQTGDPTNTGKGGESIWGKDFQDEFHSRLKFSHRGIVAMANKNTSNTNSSQFFITVDKCPWLDKKHTIFGKVTGDTFFNALSISEIPTKDDYPIVETIPIIIRVEILINPFNDIIPRTHIKKIDNSLSSEILDKSLKNFKNEEKMKNSNLISFDDDYCENDVVNFKIKPIHEIVKNDKKIINKPVINDSNLSILKNKIKNINSNVEQSHPEDNPSESSSESESEVDVILDTQKFDDSDRKNEILQLKQEIVNIKKRIKNATSDDEEEDESNKPMTALQKHQSKFLNLKKGRQNNKEAIEKFEKFKEKLKSKKSAGDWMNNKLKFQVDSTKAFAIQEVKDKHNNNIIFK
jgi:peptidyl-prolyl cis-trans isomerase SDCCAG10